MVLWWMALGIPLCYGLSVPLVSAKTPFRWPMRAAYASFGIALVTFFGGALRIAPAPRLVRLDGVARVMLILVCFVAVVIVRYSRTYLSGRAGLSRYARALLVTLAAVTVLVLSNDLVVIALAWMGTSLALHQLLTFCRDRPRARVAAHKKFLVSRLADGCLLGAIVLLGSSTSSFDLDAINAVADESGRLTTSQNVSAILIVIAVSLKSAQLPFHGWLIQVMEAPTPVSALLHAGVVNIGGFVMIRLAPFMSRAPIAQTLLVVIGTTTAVVAALVMMTRVSVKVALAWSTCAQMGFMLVECGLGAWHLALLHLVAHSLYKAHAFLGAGAAVDVWRSKALTRPRRVVAFSRILSISGLACMGIGAALAVIHPSATLLPLLVVLGLSLTSLVVRAVGGDRAALVGVFLRSFGVVGLYSVAHAATGQLFAFPESASAPLARAVVIGGFCSLFLVQLVLEYRPDSGLSRALRPRLFAGFYLDEVFTRIAFRIWPPRLERPAPLARELPITAALEVR